MIKQRELTIQKYFAMWLEKNSLELENIFDVNVLYSECYGPEYKGIEQIKKWFFDWNKKGTVLKWDIKQFIHQGNKTVVEWYFQCDYTGEVSKFDGVSIITFNTEEQIISLKEFKSKAEHEYPYGI